MCTDNVETADYVSRLKRISMIYHFYEFIYKIYTKISTYIMQSVSQRVQYALVCVSTTPLRKVEKFRHFLKLTHPGGEKFRQSEVRRYLGRSNPW